MDFVAIGNNELGEPLGTEITCPVCHGVHPVEYGTRKLDDGPVEDKTLAFYACGNKLYLAGVNGRVYRATQDDPLKVSHHLANGDCK